MEISHETAIVRRATGESFTCISGQQRLVTALQMIGKATVRDVETGETFEVHVVDDRIVVLHGVQDAIAETRMARAVEKAITQSMNGSNK
jgi:hypothetical protein